MLDFLSVVISQPPLNVAHQFLDRVAPVVPRDGCMQVFPLPLDLIVVRTIRRKKMEFDAMTVLLHPCLHLAFVESPPFLARIQWHPNPDDEFKK